MALWLAAGPCRTGPGAGTEPRACGAVHAALCPPAAASGGRSCLLPARALPCRAAGRPRTAAHAVAAQRTSAEVQVPPGYHYYETMLVLRPDMTEEERDMELAKFEAYLKQDEAQDIVAAIRGGQRLAYPIKGFWEGVYVLYTYAARTSTAQGVQKLLSTPRVGAEQNILRHMTYRS